jgi:hypothetical protein
MAKKRRRSRRRRSSARSSHRRRRRSNRSYRMRANPFMGLIPGRKRRRRGRRRASNRSGRRRRRNPDGLGSITSGHGIVPMIVGGGVGFLASRFIPQNISFLKTYNAGWTGYAMNAAIGAGASWLLGKFWTRQAAVGGYIGTGVAVIARIITEQFGGASNAGTSGDLEFDLGYYVSDRFPFAQGTGGPYDQFPGTPYLNAGPFAATNATAVRSGQAAAAALPAAAAAASPAMSGISNGRWEASRWS